MHFPVRDHAGQVPHARRHTHRLRPRAKWLRRPPRGGEGAHARGGQREAPVPSVDHRQVRGSNRGSGGGIMCPSRRPANRVTVGGLEGVRRGSGEDPATGGGQLSAVCFCSSSLKCVKPWSRFIGARPTPRPHYVLATR
eukprot:989539-Pyramimonas_sp.AAC.2